MYYRISEPYQLVGWNNLRTGVLDKEQNEVIFLPGNEYRLLLHMNGREEIDPDALTPWQRETISKFLEQKWILASETPFPDPGVPLYRRYDHCRVESVHWSITGRCNYNCRHCFVSAPDNNTEDLTTDECLDIIRQIADCGIRKISLTGGEPLIRRDLPVLIRACSDASIRITELYTNGALLTPEVANLFTGNGHRPTVHISYDGVGWHDWVRGHEGAQQTAEKAFAVARDAGLKTGASMCLFRDNVPSIRETVLRLASLSVGSIRISPMLSLGLWGEHYSEKTLSAEEFLQAVIGYIPFFFADGKPCSLSMGGYFNHYRDRDISTVNLAKHPDSPAPLHPCPWAASNIYISSTGTVLPCMEFSGSSGSAAFPELRKASLRQILKDSVLIKTTRTTTEDVYSANAECADCPERGVHCGENCRACAVPGFTGLDRDTCLFVRKGWYRQVQEAVEKAGGTFTLL